MQSPVFSFFKLVGYYLVVTAGQRLLVVLVVPPLSPSSPFLVFPPSNNENVFFFPPSIIWNVDAVKPYFFFLRPPFFRRKTFEESPLRQEKLTISSFMTFFIFIAPRSFPSFIKSSEEGPPFWGVRRRERNPPLFSSFDLSDTCFPLSWSGFFSPPHFISIF